MAVAWRFFVGEEGQWYWESVRSTGTSRSRIAYPSYEACVQAAVACGYRFLPSQEPLRRGGRVGLARSPRPGSNDTAT